MLKWLRKYNTWILVVGGSLLMIAFLIPDTIQRFGEQRMSGPRMRVAGEKISAERFGRAAQEHAALEVVFGGDTLARIGGGASLEHWFLLSHQAEKVGLVGGPEDGRENLRRILDDILSAARLDPQMMQAVLDQIPAKVASASAHTHLTEDEVYQAVSRLTGVIRMRNAYVNSPRYSDRRLIAGVKRIADQAEFQYVLVPPERLITNETAKPDEAEIQAHFDKYKSVAPRDSDIGVGYSLPPRVKIAWITLNKADAAAAVSPDPVEVQKRLLKMYGNAPPSGDDAAVARSRIEGELKAELSDKVMKTLDQAVRGEIEKIARRLEPDGEYRRLPDGWAAPDLNTVAHAAADRTAEITGVRLPPLKVESRPEWQTANELALMPGVSDASLRRGTRAEPFESVALAVRELAGPNDIVIQTGVPFGEPLADSSGNRYYLLVLDARKDSPPDTLAEVREQVVKDIQRIRAFEQLKAQADEFRRLAVEQGLEALAKAPDGVTGPAANPLNVAKASASTTAVEPAIPTLNFPAFREALLAAASALDGTMDISKVDPGARTVVVPSPRALGLVVARINWLEPMTLERYRALQAGMVSRLQRDELGATEGAPDPFSQDAMEKRLNVEYLDADERPKRKAEPQPAA